MPIGDLTDLVEEERPAVGLLEAPFAAGDRAGEGAALVPEQLALEERLGQRRAVQAHERTLGARAGQVDRLGDELLAGAALAADQDRGARRPDLRDQREHLLHLRVVGDDVTERVALAQAIAQLPRFLDQARLVHRAVDHGRQGREVERLGEVILGPLLHRLDGAADGAEGGHHHEDRSRRGRLRLVHEGDAIEPGHLQIGEDHVGDELFELAQRLESVGRGLRRVAFFPQDLAEGGARVGLVVDDEDAAAAVGGRRRAQGHALQCMRLNTRGAAQNPFVRSERGIKRRPRMVLRALLPVALVLSFVETASAQTALGADPPPVPGQASPAPLPPLPPVPPPVPPPGSPAAAPSPDPVAPAGSAAPTPDALTAPKAPWKDELVTNPETLPDAPAKPAPAAAAATTGTARALDGEILVDPEWKARELELMESSAINGGVGLLHMQHAQGGAPRAVPHRLHQRVLLRRLPLHQQLPLPEPHRKREDHERQHAAHRRHALAVGVDLLLARGLRVHQRHRQQRTLPTAPSCSRSSATPTWA